MLLLVAGHAEVLLVLGDEALGPDGLLTAVADEAGLMPAAALVLHLAGTCGDRQEQSGTVTRQLGAVCPGTGHPLGLRTERRFALKGSPLSGMLSRL